MPLTHDLACLENKYLLHGSEIGVCLPKVPKPWSCLQMVQSSTCSTRQLTRLLGAGPGPNWPGQLQTMPSGCLSPRVSSLLPSSWLRVNPRRLLQACRSVFFTCTRLLPASRCGCLCSAACCALACHCPPPLCLSGLASLSYHTVSTLFALCNELGFFIGLQRTPCVNPTLLHSRM